MRVLIVDDDDETRELLERTLTKHALKSASVATADDAITSAHATPFDAIVLDVMLGQGSGIDVCKRLRAAGNDTPILFLSARGTVRARLEGLDAGGDDYLPKPFALSEVVARLRALARRGSSFKAPAIAMGDLSLDLRARRAVRGGKVLPITAREWSVIEVLSAASGRVVSFDELLERAWGDPSESSRASLEVIVSRLRRKLGTHVIRTARGQGYALGDA